MRFASRVSVNAMPTLLRGALAVLTIPFATALLDPKDFGLYALIVALSGLATGVSSAGVGAFFAAHLEDWTDQRRVELISSVLAATVALAALSGAALSGAVLFLPGIFPEFAIPRSDAAILVFGIVILGAFTQFSFTYGSVAGNSHVFAGYSLLGVALSPLVLLYCLYVLGIGIYSLFAALISSMTFDAVFALYVLRHVIRPKVSRLALARFLRFSLLLSPAGLAEQAKSTADRVLIANFATLSSLGLYSHGLQYVGIIQGIVKAFSVSAWNISLKEARSEQMNFEKTTSSWAVVHIFILICIFFVSTLGEFLIGLLTHGKFSQSYIFAVLGLVLLMLQSSGKAAVATIYSKGAYRENSALVISGSLGAIAAALPAGYLFGIWGVLFAGFLQPLTYRIGASVLARRRFGVVEHDPVAVYGILAAIPIACGFYFYEASLVLRVSSFVMLSAATAFIFRAKLSKLVALYGLRSESQ